MNLTLLPALVTALALLLLFGTAAAVGRGRGKYGIKAPATSGHPDFDRLFRVQMNTLEMTVLFLPALWLAATYWNPVYAGYVGLVWLAARIWYAFAYAAEANRRGPAFLVSVLSFATLLIASLVGIIKAVLA